MNLKFIFGRGKELSSLSLREQRITTQNCKKNLNHMDSQGQKEHFPLEGGRQYTQGTMFILL